MRYSCASFLFTPLNELMKKLRLALVFVVLAAALAALASGPMLVSDHAEKSDVIVVLGGDRNEIRYNRAVELLRAGYGQRLLLDADLNWTFFGRTEVEYAREFLEHAPEDIRSKVQVCPYDADSTFEEVESVAQCLKKLQVHPRPAGDLHLSHETGAFDLPKA